MEIVVDTSVLIAVIANEPEKPLLVQLTIGANLVAPASVHWEIGNAFSAMLKRNRITLDEAQQAVSTYHAIPLRLLDIDLAPALNIAAQFNLYAYDAYLLSCALQQKAPLLTLDSGLRYAAQQARVRLVEVTS
jgi:predicted nucleic acid-binding protein